MANKRIKDLATTKYKGFMALDDADGTGKYDITNIFNDFATEFIENQTNAVANSLYWHNGSLFYAKENYSGVWDSSKFVQTSFREFFYKKLNFLYMDLTSATSGGQYDIYGNIISSGSSSYIELTLTSSKRVVVRSPAGTLATNTRYYVLKDASGNVVESVTNADARFGYMFKATPANGWKLLCSWTTSYGLPFIASIDGNIEPFFNALKLQADSLDKELNGSIEYSDFDLSGATAGYFYDEDGNLVSNASSAYINISLGAADEGKHISIRNEFHDGTIDLRYYLLLDDNNTIIDKVTNVAIKTDYNGNYIFPVTVKNGWTLRCSWKTTLGTPLVSKIVSSDIPLKEEIEGYVKYVSTNGDDANVGSKSMPVKTISKAVELGAEVIIIKEGVYNDTQLDLSKSIHDCVTIKGEACKKVIFKRASSKAVDSGSETLVSGYTKVYSVDCSQIDYGTGEGWLFFDGLNDASQPITPQDAHPLERGLHYRNDCTKIRKTTATALADALTEIEACGANEYKWYWNGGKLYFNRADSTSIYPIYKPYGNYLVTRADQSVRMSNLEFRYSALNLDGLNGVELQNVTCKYVYGAGCFTYNNSISVVLDHCEASSCFYSSVGDGFNGHANVPTDKSSKCCQITLRECWAHDNLDDGYSDHEYAETSLDGGLYEYNGGDGVVPAYGSHCECKNVYSRNNGGSGFCYSGGSSDYGNGGQMTCYCCVSESNNTANSSSNAGFKIDTNGSKAILVDCKSISNHTAYRADGPYTYMHLIDCGHLNNDVAVTSGNGVFTKLNTSKVE